MKNEGAQRRSFNFFRRRPLPKQGGTPARRRDRSGNERQWAEAVVRKAMPRIMESLIDAAAFLGERSPALPGRPARHGPDEVEDESLAALLLRLLRTPDAENSDTGADQMTSASENHR